MANLVICTNGHVTATVNHGPIRPAQQRIEEEERRRARHSFCTRCGAANLRKCPSCSYLISIRCLGERPAFCAYCGKAFPWTETALRAAREYADELNLSSDETMSLKSTLNDLASDSPRTELAAHRFKKFLQKIGPAAGDALKTIIVNFATDGAKKALGGW